jgi:uncharacterized protein (TIGR00266 family)
VIHEISDRPSFSRLVVSLDRGESIRAEAGAMVDHSDGVAVTTEAAGGVLKSLARSVLGGESFFVSTFAAAESGTVTLAPPYPGDIVSRALSDGALYVQASSYLAAEPTVELDTTFGGIRTALGGEGLFVLRLSGSGTVFLASFGAIEERALERDERYVVDSGHVVAFDDSVRYAVEPVGGLKSTLTSGEGLVFEFAGPGSVWTQSRSPEAFAAWLAPLLPPRAPVVAPVSTSGGTGSRGVRAARGRLDPANRAVRPGGTRASNARNAPDAPDAPKTRSAVPRLAGLLRRGRERVRGGRTDGDGRSGRGRTGRRAGDGDGTGGRSRTGGGRGSSGRGGRGRRNR